MYFLYAFKCIKYMFIFSILAKTFWKLKNTCVTVVTVLILFSNVLKSGAFQYYNSLTVSNRLDPKTSQFISEYSTTTLYIESVHINIMLKENTKDFKLVTMFLIFLELSSHDNIENNCFLALIHTLSYIQFLKQFFPFNFPFIRIKYIFS